MIINSQKKQFDYFIENKSTYHLGGGKSVQVVLQNFDHR